MTLREELDELSAKATQGEWTHSEYFTYQDGAFQKIRGQHGCWIGDVHTGEAEFIAVLVNAYRAGKLVVKEG